MLNFRLTTDAKSDLIGIRRFTIEQWGMLQSQKYLSGIRQTIRLLAKTPTLGTNRLEIGSNVSSFPYESHVIYYAVYNQQLVVFGVLHKRMVPLNHLVERDIL